MTSQHPLTDDFCYRISETFPPDAAERNNMRSAADWQLEQAIEWLGDCNMDHSLSYDKGYVSDRYLVINAFREAMRPTTTTTQEEN